MRKAKVENTVVFFLIVVTFLVSLYFYRKGEVNLAGEDTYKEPSLIKITPFLEKKFHLNLTKNNKGEILTIARFEEDEQWDENGNFDLINFIEGNSSLYLNSENQHLVKAQNSLGEKKDISSYEEVGMFIYLHTLPENIEEILLTIFNKKGDSEVIPITNLISGWNYWTYSCEKFSSEFLKKSEVDKITISVKSRKDKVVLVSFDYLFFYKGEIRATELKGRREKPLVYFENLDGKMLPLISSYFNQTITIKRVTSVKNFDYRAKIVPFKPGPLGLFIKGDINSNNGYYFIVGGINKYDWQFLVRDKENNELLRGEINNFLIEANKEIWLRAKTVGNIIFLSFSVDGINYSNIGNIKDNTFSAGGVGVCGFDGVTFTVEEVLLLQ